MAPLSVHSEKKLSEEQHDCAVSRQALSRYSEHLACEIKYYRQGARCSAGHGLQAGSVGGESEDTQAERHHGLVGRRSLARFLFSRAPPLVGHRELTFTAGFNRDNDKSN